VDGDELAAGVVDAHEIALVDGDVAGAAGEGRTDVAIIELEPGVGGDGLAGELLGLEGAGGIGDGLELFLEDESALVQGSVTVDLRLGGAELDLDALKVGLGGAQGVLKGAGIDLEEAVALFHILPLDEVDLHERAGDLRAHGGAATGLDGTDGLEGEGHDLALGFAHDHRGGTAGARAAARGGVGLGATGDQKDRRSEGEDAGEGEGGITIAHGRLDEHLGTTMRTKSTRRSARRVCHRRTFSLLGPGERISLE